MRFAETSDRNLKERKMQMLKSLFPRILIGAFSATHFSVIFFKGLKKGESSFCFASLVYGRFLSNSTTITAPITIMTITIIATPNMTVPVDAKPVGGEAVGAAVGAGALA